MFGFGLVITRKGFDGYILCAYFNYIRIYFIYFVVIVIVIIFFFWQFTVIVIVYLVGIVKNVVRFFYLCLLIFSSVLNT